MISVPLPVLTQASVMFDSRTPAYAPHKAESTTGVTSWLYRSVLLSCVYHHSTTVASRVVHTHAGPVVTSGGLMDRVAHPLMVTP